MAKKRIKPKKRVTITSTEHEPIEASDKVQINFQQVFYKDLSSSLPALYQQLQAKDVQIQQLNNTITSLIEKNNELQQKMLSPETIELYRLDANNGGEIPPPNNNNNNSDWSQFGPKPFLLLLTLIIFMVFGLKAFDHYAKNPYSETFAQISDYQNQNNHELITKYEGQILALNEQKEEKVKEAKELTYTIDTLSSAVSMLTTRLNKEGKKSETIDALTKQLEKKDVSLRSLEGSIDSVKRLHKAQLAMTQELNDKTKLLEAINDINHASVGEERQNSSNNIIYLLIMALMVAVVFMALSRRP